MPDVAHGKKGGFIQVKLDLFEDKAWSQSMT